MRVSQRMHARSGVRSAPSQSTQPPGAQKSFCISTTIIAERLRSSVMVCGSAAVVASNGVAGASRDRHAWGLPSRRKRRRQSAPCPRHLLQCASISSPSRFSKRCGRCFGDQISKACAKQRQARITRVQSACCDGLRSGRSRTQSCRIRRTFGSHWRRSRAPADVVSGLAVSRMEIERRPFRKDYISRLKPRRSSSADRALLRQADRRERERARILPLLLPMM